MPDDNEFQNLTDKIRPRPEIQTGKIEFEGLYYGYIRISNANDERVYEVNSTYPQKTHYINEGQAFIRRGSVMYIMNQKDRKKVEKMQKETRKFFPSAEYIKYLIQLKQEKGLLSLTIAELIGGWDEKIIGGRILIEEITDQDYGSWITELQQLKVDGASNIVFFHGKWKVRNRNEYLTEVKRSIFDTHIDKLKELAIKVLTDQNRKYDLSIQQRNMSSVYGRDTVYSKLLKRGISEALAILSSKRDEFGNCSVGLIESTIHSVVFETLHN